MELDFNVWAVATNRQEASAEIANRVEQIQQLYAEAVLIAKEFDTYVSVSLELPDGTEGGHNRNEYAHWSASAAHC